MGGRGEGPCWNLGIRSSQLAGNKKVGNRHCWWDVFRGIRDGCGCHKEAQANDRDDSLSIPSEDDPILMLL